MKNTATKINWKGMECIQLCAGGYTALIAPGIGSNVLRLHDDAHGVEFFRWDENNTPEDIKQSAEVWGLPTLYLPNRLMRLTSCRSTRLRRSTTTFTDSCTSGNTP